MRHFHTQIANKVHSTLIFAVFQSRPMFRRKSSSCPILLFSGAADNFAHFSDQAIISHVCNICNFSFQPRFRRKCHHDPNFADFHSTPRFAGNIVSSPLLQVSGVFSTFVENHPAAHFCYFRALLIILHIFRPGHYIACLWHFADFHSNQDFVEHAISTHVLQVSGMLHICEPSIV